MVRRDDKGEGRAKEANEEEEQHAIIDGREGHVAEACKKMMRISDGGKKGKKSSIGIQAERV